jgi:hypothetical protein
VSFSLSLLRSVGEKRKREREREREARFFDDVDEEEERADLSFLCVQRFSFLSSTSSTTATFDRCSPQSRSPPEPALLSSRRDERKPGKKRSTKRRRNEDDAAVLLALYSSSRSHHNSLSLSPSPSPTASSCPLRCCWPASAGGRSARQRPRSHPFPLPRLLLPCCFSQKQTQKRRPP